MKHTNPDRALLLYLFLFFVSLYLLTSSGGAVYDSDQSMVRYETTRAIVERFDLSVPGQGIRGIDGRDYSWYGIGQPLMAIPFYAAGKFTGFPQAAVSIMNELFSAGTVVLIFLFCLSLGYSRRASCLVAIFYGLGTMAWPLSKQPFDHPVEAFCVLSSVYFMYRYTASEKLSGLVLSSFGAGLAFTIRYVPCLIVPPLLTQIIIHHARKSHLRSATGAIVRDILLFSLAFSPFLCLSLWYNQYRFGSPFETGSSLIATRAGIDLFGSSTFLRGLSGFLISPGKGLFYYSPVALLFFFSLKPFIRRSRSVAACFILIIVSYLLFLSNYMFWHGDWAWGPRYLLAITPFLIIPIAELFDSAAWYRKKMMRTAAWSLFLISLIIQLAAVSVFFQKYFVSLRYKEKVRFVVAHGDGILPTVVPPSEIYFDWRRSPVLYQFTFLGETLLNKKNFDYSKLPGHTFPSQIKADPDLKVFDFWWAYQYVLRKTYFGLAVAAILFSLVVYAGVRLLQECKKNPERTVNTADFSVS
jgi:4-amino-4-deoxy-L-arabinose transferase-like glycosyltransferase